MVEVSHQTIARGPLREHHLVATALAGLPAELALTSVVDEVGGLLDEAGATPLILRLHGPRGALQEARDAAATAGLGAAVAYVAGRPPARVAAQVWAFEPLDPAVRLEEGPGFRALRGPGLHLVHLPALTGTHPEPGAQATQALERARLALADRGLRYRDVARTWLYVREITRWYGQLNAARSAFHAGVGLTGDPDAPFPASTGIEATRSGEWLALEILAARGPRWEPIPATSLQAPAWDYGSAFSRGVALRWDRGETVFASGTASIDPRGRTAHPGDLEAQLGHTLAAVEAVLSTRGAGLRDVVSGALYARTPADLAHAEALIAGRSLPLVPVVGSVCREDLLVEIEAVAVVS